MSAGRTNLNGRFCGEDCNEELCGTCNIAWTPTDMLICCELCPAAYHPECAGYSDLGDVPDGDWLCWFCAKRKGGTAFPPKRPYHGDGNVVFVASDATLEVFYKGTVAADHGDNMIVEYTDHHRKTEMISKADPRVWCGTTAQYAWVKEPDGAFRPKARAFMIDMQKLMDAGLQGNAGASGCTASPPTVAKTSSKEGTRTATQQEMDFSAALDLYWKRRGEKRPAHNPAIYLPSLWKSVMSKGGYESVQEGQLWAKVAEELDPEAVNPMLPFFAKSAYKDVLGGFEAIGGVEGLPRARLEDIKRAGVNDLKRKKQQLGRGKGRPAKSGEGHSDVQHPQDTSRSHHSAQVSDEARTAVGLLELTNDAKSLSVGDWVEVRSMTEGYCGAWYLGEIAAIAPGSPWEGYRRFHIKYLEFSPVSWEWVPLLSRGLAAKHFFQSPIVMVRLPQLPYRPAELDDDSPPPIPHMPEGMTPPSPYRPEVGHRVEAWWEGGWWMASVLEINQDGTNALVQGDPKPLGMGQTWTHGCDRMRKGHPLEECGMGMVVYPPKRSQMLHPLMLEKRLSMKRKGDMMCYRCAEQAVATRK